MKKLEIIIQPEKLEALKAILDASNVSGIMISNIMGYGNQKGHKQFYRGAEYSVNLLPKIKVETVVEPEVAEPLIRKIVEEIKTGAYGWIMISSFFITESLLLDLKKEQKRRSPDNRERRRS